MTKDGLFEDALMRPHDPSSRVNLIPLTVRILIIFKPSMVSSESLIFLIFNIKSSMNYLKHINLQLWHRSVKMKRSIK